MTQLLFEPVPSVAPFFVGDKLMNFIVGPVGSTKTTGGLMKIVWEASQVAKSRDGLRRSRYAVVRNTRQMLLDSTIPDFLKWCQDGVAGTFQKTELRFLLKFGDVHSEILFRGLDDSNDVRRLLSLQLTGAFIDEFRELSPDVFNALTGRIGRYPDGLLVPHRPEWGLDSKGNPIQGCVNDKGHSMKRLWGSTNPPDADTFWHTLLEDPPATAQVTIQPGGLTQEADWIHLLPENYYEDLVQGKSQEWIDVYVNGRWGVSLAGKPVFRSFNLAQHVADAPLRYLKTPSMPLILGMDFGLNPSAVIGQIDMFGRLLVLDALTADGMGLTRFIQTVLKPTLARKYPGMPTTIIGDPAGVNRSQTDEKSCFDILRQEGLRAIPARTNNIVARIAAVDTFLMRTVDSKSGVLIDPEARPLIRALRGEYRYKLKKNNELEDTPEKNDASHIADAFQYLCLHADGGLRGMNTAPKRREIKVVSARGWT